jgi:hypothetical protein
MATIDAQAPDGKTLSIDVPEGTPESAYPQMVDEVVQHYMQTPGALESFGRAAVNNLPAGGQIGALGTSALTGKDYSQSLQDFNQKAIDAKAAHPVAYGAGAVTGAVAPLAIPGVGEAMEAAGPVATGAALGGANAIGNIDLKQNPDEAVRQGLVGAGLGAGIGAIMPNGKGLQEDVEGYANKKAVQTLGLRPGVLGIPGDELDDLGKFASEAGLTQGSLEQRVNQAQAMLKQTGEQIGGFGAGTAPLQDAEPFINQLHNKIQESGDIFGTGANPEAPLYQAGVDQLSHPGLTFDRLQQLKTSIGQRAFDASGEVKNDAAANLYGVYKDAMKSIINDSPQEYQAAMTTYGKLKDIESGLMGQFQREQATGIQTKGFGMAGKLGGMVTGGNVPATVAGAVGLGIQHPFMGLGLASTIFTNPQAMESAARGVAGAIPTAIEGSMLGTTDAVTTHLLKTMSSNPQSLGKYAKPLMQAAQTGGKQGLAVQHFLLSSQYPDYNEMIMHGSKEGVHHALHSAIEGDDNANR